LATYHLAITTTIVTNPDIAEAIVQTAEQDKVDLIAMATHGRGGIQRWALGSVTERVLHASKVPLFLMRPQAK
jgi:nucleotide-binding universal stress UspA family protein